MKLHPLANADGFRHRGQIPDKCITATDTFAFHHSFLGRCAVPKQQIQYPSPTGIAFDVDDLNLLCAWANQHAIQMSIELDNCVDGEEYEEIIAFQTERCALHRWIVWRTTDGVTVQPLIGRARRFGSVYDMIEALTLVIM